MACSTCNCSNTKCGCKDTPLTTAPVYTCPPDIKCPDPTPCFETLNAQCVVYTGPTVAAVPLNGSVQDAILSTLDNIMIPNLRVGTLQGSVQAALDFYTCKEWLNHNPRIFLFRTKGVKKAQNYEGNTFKGRPSQFVHPTHLSSSGSKWFNGSAKYDDTYGGAPILRHTEFAIPNFTPYQRFNLENLGLNRYEWVTYVQKECNVIEFNASNNTTGSFGNTLYSLGTISGRPYYEFTDPGTSKVFRIYFDVNTNNWIVQWTGESYPYYNCSLGTDSQCPATNQQPSWSCVNNSGSGVFFYDFRLKLAGNTIKRQALQSDVDQYTSKSCIGSSGSISNETGIWFNINLKDGSHGSTDFSNQKIHFKLAIVIDNPNPTPEVPYLIGPMSDAFVLRFYQFAVNSADELHYCAFTNDYISKIVT